MLHALNLVARINFMLSVQEEEDLSWKLITKIVRKIKYFAGCIAKRVWNK